MVFGFAAAIVFGFLLTAVPKWTGTQAISGRPLALVFSAWALGRFAMLTANYLPQVAVMVACLLVYPLMLSSIGRAIVSTRNRRNYAFPVLLSVLAAADLASQLAHMGTAGLELGSAQLAIKVGLYVMVMMVVVVGGRIVPVFTNAALRRAQRSEVVRTAAKWEHVIAPWIAATFITLVLGAPQALAVPLLAGSTLLLLLRSYRHSPQLSRGEPLLWVLHAGYFWLPIGFACLAFSRAGLGFAESTALHGLAAGSIGAMILAMISRVSLGHTGRPLVAPRGMVPAFFLVLAAGLVRTFGPVFLAAHYAEVIIVSAGLWIAAFAIFVARYANILLRARVDGRPG
jgi:uncharacterized protein involved in response to NO